MKCILACDSKGGIGYQNKLPWSKIQGDLARFKELTSNQVVVMGRNTWESLPKKPLPNRLNIIVSSQQLDLPPGAIATNNLDHFKHYNNVWFIGGAKLLESCWDLITEIHLTKTFTEYTCDTFVDLDTITKEFSCTRVEQFADHEYQIWKRNGTIS